VKFHKSPVGEAEGALLAHSVRSDGLRFSKGHKLTAADISALLAADVRQIFVARLDPDDVPENAAAEQLGRAVTGQNIRARAPFTGRVNLHAETAGLVIIDVDAVNRINAVDEGLTLATLRPSVYVTSGQMLGTIKTIPFALSKQTLDTILKQAQSALPAISIAPLRSKRAGLICTRLPHTTEKELKRNHTAITERLTALGSTLAVHALCDHDIDAIAGAVRDCIDKGCDPILIYGASAIVDRDDVIPSGIVAAGGTITHFGMPVDPGNLLLLAKIGQRAVVGLPGCTKSPKQNGIDWVLWRLLADVPITSHDIQNMGVGGLLKDTPSRPHPREAVGEAVGPGADPPRIAAVILAAGQSRRMADENKLLKKLKHQTLISMVTSTVMNSGIDHIVVVTGHDKDAIEAELAGRSVTFVHNPDFAAGLSTSLRVGVNALPRHIDGFVICLGDMPSIHSNHIKRLIAAFDVDEGRAICVPTHHGKRGNPVLWAARFLNEMSNVTGDVGAKHLIGEYEEFVFDVEMDDGAVLLDLDTPEAMAAYQRQTD